MTENEGFWKLLSDMLYIGFFSAGLLYFRKAVFEILYKRDFSLKVAGQELTVQNAAHNLGKYVTELQDRVAKLEAGIKDEGKILLESDMRILESSSRDRILWVDDYPSNNAFIIERLQSRNFDIDLALSTEDGIKSFVAFDPKIIISDLGRVENGRDNLFAGLDLINQIRKINKNIPILIFAGGRGEKMKEALIAAGASDVTSSGIDVMKFIEKHMN